MKGTAEGCPPIAQEKKVWEIWTSMNYCAPFSGSSEGQDVCVCVRGGGVGGGVGGDKRSLDLSHSILSCIGYVQSYF